MFIRLIKLFFIFTFLFGAGSVFAQNYGEESMPLVSPANEYVRGFDVTIDVSTDGSALVKETISYDFGALERHGIFRIIPIGFLAKGEPYYTHIEVESVESYDGFPYKYEVTSSDPFTVMIGSEKEMVTGQNTYVITYRVDRVIGFFKNYDELYWNLTGDAWEVPLVMVGATVRFPVGTNVDSKLLHAYCGKEGENTTCGAFSFDDDGNVVWKMGQGEVLYPKEGATIAIGFEKGIVITPYKSDLFLGFLRRYWFIPFPFLLAFLFLRKRILFSIHRWRYFLRNPIVAEYDANGISPLEAGLIINKTLAPSDMAAGIVSLAIAGYIDIENTAQGFCFKKKKNIDEKMEDELTPLFDVLAGKCEKDLGLPYMQAVHKVIAQTKERLLSRGFATRMRLSLANKAVNILAPLVLAFFPGIFVWTLMETSFGFIFSGACVLIAVYFIFAKPLSLYLTQGGFTLEQKLLGLKHYIEVAEADRINFHNAPAKTPELFEKLLPYAMIFGLEKKWAKEFENLYNTTPHWYISSPSTPFSSITLVDSLHSFSAVSSGIVAASVPSSSSRSWGGSSGSFGGGFSGGGGGGGGGGSW